MRRQIIGAAAVLAAFALLMPAGAAAQATTNAEGFVLTPEGEPIPDVKVLLQYKGHMPQNYRTKTDENGRFIHLRVWSGLYDITFSREGFPDVTQKDFVVRDIIHPDKPPVFRLHARTIPPPPPEPEEETPRGPTAEEMAGDLAAELDAANEHLAAGRLDEALAAYEKVAAAAPDLPEVHHNIGLAARKKGDLARAEMEFRKAAELDPDFPEPHGALAVLLAQAGNRDEAIIEAEMAVELDPEDTQSLYNLAVMYKDSGRPRTPRRPSSSSRSSIPTTSRSSSTWARRSSAWAGWTRP